MSDFAVWVKEFDTQAQRRIDEGDPSWEQRAHLHPAVIRSVQRFQVGESGDGANLIAKAQADGPGDYAMAAALFVAEEQRHARLLAALLEAAGAPLIASHWSDAFFVRLRRALGLSG